MRTLKIRSSALGTGSHFTLGDDFQRSFFWDGTKEEIVARLFLLNDHLYATADTSIQCGRTDSSDRPGRKKSASFDDGLDEYGVLRGDDADGIDELLESIAEKVLD